MRPVVYYIAATLDGFIAREDGSFDDFPWDDAFVAHLRAMYPETFPAPLRDEGATPAWLKVVTGTVYFLQKLDLRAVISSPPTLRTILRTLEAANRASGAPARTRSP